MGYCLRKFHGLIGDLVRGAWLRYIRRHNHDLLGTTTDLAEFLFGTERAHLGEVRGVLADVQAGRCFYCERPLRSNPGHVDHFIPWSRYPVDLGHNFVLAHDSCNSAKADHLAAADYLEAWVDRNVRHQSDLADQFTMRGILHDLATSLRVADWAYRQSYEGGGRTWARNQDLVTLPPDWAGSLGSVIQALSG